MVRQPDLAMALSSYFPGHGDRRYGVTHYDLDLRYRLSTNWLSGLATLSVETVEPVTDLELDLGPFRVNSAKVDGTGVRHTHRAGRLRVLLDRPRPAGAAIAVEIAYAGRPHPVASPFGGVGWEELTDGAMVASQPTGAPSWFPCNDRPDDKATYSVTVTTAAPYQVLANGAPVARRRAAGATTWVFAPTEPMATYLATVQIGRYQTMEGLACPARLAAKARHDFGRQGEMMALFTDRFGAYPFSGYTAVVADDDLEIPIEAQGLSIFGRNHVDGRRGFERLVAHELAHQWFGNSLTLARWSDIWLHEGFAAYAEWIWSEASGGESAAELAGRWHQRLSAMPQDFTLADPGPALLFDDRVYKRGALTLHRLRTEMGDAAFFSMVRAWTAAHRHGTVSTAAFLAHAPAALEPLLSSWLYARELPRFR
ncbi:M1 family metallopeptidase [Nonomuraea africana]|uniref:Aminopeptidase N n=1 Tax=Nonomuraea africana TaxID=46171 RepID=A0ABR9KC71_9ACTN|nr:M1 family metallopeptidase [Nonomuraea africana]MBE1559611.1 aminopeptidase N [Nonomuraea africana]